MAQDDGTAIWQNWQQLYAAKQEYDQQKESGNRMSIKNATEHYNKLGGDTAFNELSQTLQTQYPQLWENRYQNMVQKGMTPEMLALLGFTGVIGAGVAAGAGAAGAAAGAGGSSAGAAGGGLTAAEAAATPAMGAGYVAPAIATPSAEALAGTAAAGGLAGTTGGGSTNSTVNPNTFTTPSTSSTVDPNTLGSLIQGGTALVAGQQGVNAANEATEEMRRQFDIGQENMAPWLEAGRTALTAQQELMGLGETGPEGQLSALMSSPGYQFRLGQGQRSLEASSAARGGMGSGKAGTAMAQFGQDYASNEYGNRLNQLAGLSGTGQSQAQYGAGLGMGYAGEMGNASLVGANARQSGIIGAGSALSNLMNPPSNSIGNFSRAADLSTNYFSGQPDATIGVTPNISTSNYYGGQSPQYGIGNNLSDLTRGR